MSNNILHNSRFSFSLTVDEENCSLGELCSFFLFESGGDETSASDEVLLADEELVDDRLTFFIGFESFNSKKKEITFTFQLALENL